MSSIIGRNCGLGHKPKVPRKVVLGAANSPRELPPPVLRKANRPCGVTVHEDVTPSIAERAAGMSQNVLVRKFKDMLG